MWAGLDLRKRYAQFNLMQMRKAKAVVINGGRESRWAWEHVLFLHHVETISAFYFWFSSQLQNGRGSMSLMRLWMLNRT